ncbi:hypothetical protein P3T76_011389 [Phytophthora citrophthora]|uniref:Uncharacterized protein n=1 Tax=Phytophthora citrophthora TaxID=4793 RepID=A0AAD9G9A9_9STRA|nr:hypothetical protein P3T76_011389 [Phytophthora citrophthora]
MQRDTFDGDMVGRHPATRGVEVMNHRLFATKEEAPNDRYRTQTVLALSQARQRRGRDHNTIAAALIGMAKARRGMAQ